jgi:hypothetical protein
MLTIAINPGRLIRKYLVSVGVVVRVLGDNSSG